MDNIRLKGKLNEFKKFHSLLEESDANSFEKFVNYSLLNADYADFTFDKVSTDNAHGIDGIAICINGLIISDIQEAEFYCKMHYDVSFVLIQTKASDNFDSGGVGKFITEVENFFTSKNIEKIDHKLKKMYEIKEYIYNTANDKMNNYPDISLFFVYAGRKKKEVSDTFNKYIESSSLFKYGEKNYLYRNFSYFIMGGDEIINAYNEAQNNLEKKIPFAKHVALPKMKDVKSAYLGVLKCKDFIDLITKDESNCINKGLFADNVRDFLGQNGRINQNIISTIDNKDEKDKFAILNNGITILAKRIVPSGDEFTITKFQIVNGCQTSHILFRSKNEIDDDMYLTVKLIETENINLSGKIIETTNSQAEVRKEALISIDPYHGKIEEYFSARRPGYPYFYERRSHQFDDDKNIKKEQIVSIPSLIKSFISVILSEPHKVHYYYGTLVQEYMKDNDSVLFNNQYNPGIYFIAHHIVYLCNAKSNKKRELKPWLYHIALLVKNKLLPELTLKSQLKDSQITSLLEKINTNFEEAYNLAVNLISGRPKNDNRNEIVTKQLIDSLVSHKNKNNRKSGDDEKNVNRRVDDVSLSDGSYKVEVCDVNVEKNQITVAYGPASRKTEYILELHSDRKYRVGEKITILVKNGKLMES